MSKVSDSTQFVAGNQKNLTLVYDKLYSSLKY